MKKYCAAFLLFFLSAPLAHGAFTEQKSLKGRLGLGFTNQVATAADGTIPALSAKYYMSHAYAVALATGFDTRSGASTLALGLKLFRNVFYESNLIFYFGGGLAYVNRNGNKMQGSLFLGSEFFFAQLPSLGFSFEAGLRGDSTTGSFAIRTTGDSFLTAGMHFYF
jgi:hypothetical protein